MKAESENGEESEDCRWGNRAEGWKAFSDVTLKSLDIVLKAGKSS